MADEAAPIRAKVAPILTPTLAELREEKTESVNGLFISNRREDSEWVSGLLHERLVAHFGPDVVITDVDSMPLGVDFKDYIDRQVNQCDIFLAVIGEKWLSVTDDESRPRLSNAEDFLRLEIEAALQRDIPVILLLVGGVIMPSANELPETIKALAHG